MNLKIWRLKAKSDDEMIKVWISGNQLPLKVEVQENILNSNKNKYNKIFYKLFKKLMNYQLQL